MHVWWMLMIVGTVLLLVVLSGCKISCENLPDPRREIFVLPVRVEMTPTPTPTPEPVCHQVEYY
jgi:hypothetical protein